MASSSSSLGLGDGIVLEALRKLFRHQKDGQDHTELSAAKELSDLSPDLILNLVSLALGVILSSGSHQAILHKSSFGKQLTAQLGGTPHTPTRSSKYNLSSKLAELCIELGYSDSNLGYQTFLHSNGNELKKVFIFLIEKLPKDREKSDLGSPPSSAREVKSLETTKVTTPPPPHDSCDNFCSCDKCLGILTDEDAINLLPRETRGAAYDVFSKAKKNLQNISSSVDAKIEFQPETEKFKPVPIPVLQRQNSSSGEEEAIEEDEEQVEKESEDEPNPIKLLQDEALDAERKLREKQADYKSLRTEILQLRRDIAANDSAKEETDTRNRELEGDLESKSKIVTHLLPNAVESREKVLAKIDKYKAKKITLEEAFDELVIERNDEFAELQKKQEAFSTDQSEEAQMMTLIEEKTAQSRKKLLEKEAACKKYSAAIDAAKIGEPRSYYTQRILEYMKSIKRQENETNIIIEDIKRVQKEINMLEGKQARTYGEAETTMFQVAKRDPYVAAGYRMLSDIHRVTALIVESERRCGKIKRANKDLQNQCQNEKDKKSGDKLDKLKEDLKVVREENKVMKMELKTKERAAQAETAK